MAAPDPAVRARTALGTALGIVHPTAVPLRDGRVWLSSRDDVLPAYVVRALEAQLSRRAADQVHDDRLLAEAVGVLGAEIARARGDSPAAGATAAFDALYAAVTLAEESGRALIVLFTDGEDNMSFLGAKPLAAAVQRSNALVHVVGWRPPREVAESDQAEALRQIAEGSGGRSWEADSPDRLRRAFTAIADAMGHRYVLRYEPQGVKREGWHRIDIKLRGQKGDVQARHGYWIAP